MKGNTFKLALYKDYNRRCRYCDNTYRGTKRSQVCPICKAKHMEIGRLKRKRKYSGYPKSVKKNIGI